MKCWSIAVLLLAAVLAEKALARPGDAAENEDGFQDDDAGPGPDQGAEEGAGAAPAVPKLLSAPLRITPRPGDTVVLPCVVENPSTVIWLNGSCTLYLGVRRLCVPNDTRISLHEDHSLEIQNVQPHDSGDYVCKLSGSLLLTHHINVFEPPRIVSTSQRQNNLEQGEHVQLFCNATGFPEPKIKWTRKGRKLPNGHREHHGSELHFSHVGPKHSGDYVCSATNALGTVHHNFVLTVSAGPEVDFDKDVYNTNVGRTVEIGCIVHAYPPATVTWQLNNGVVQGSRFEMFKDQEFHSGSRHVLRIHQVVDTDFGTYRCLAENERGTARRVVQLSGLPTPARLDEVTYEKGRPVLLWTVESLSPVDKYELMYRRQNSSEWTSTRTPTVQLPVVEGNIYKVKYELRDVETADYEAKLKAHNLFGWSELSQKYPFSAESFKGAEPSRVGEAGSGAQAGSGAPVERISFGLLLGAVAFFLTRS